MSNKPDGGPAFPKLRELRTEEGRTVIYEARYDAAGMSLRDYFAGQALAGILSGICSGHQIGSPGTVIKIDESVISTAYVTADLMLAARGK